MSTDIPVSDDLRASSFAGPDMSTSRTPDAQHSDRSAHMDGAKEARGSVHSMDSADHSELSSIAEEDHELLQKGEPDLEIQAIPETPSTPTEYSTSTSKKLVYLALYFLLNLSVTLSNKALLQGLSFPWLLTFSHTTATSLGCTILLLTGQLKLSTLCLRDNIILLAFSTLFTLNIAISNVSLALVSVPFHQVMRSTCPVATILIYKVGYNRAYSSQTWLSMVPLVLGVGLATFGDYYFTMAGFLLTLLGVVLAAVKTVATNNLMTGSLKLSAMEVLFRMCPLAALQCLLYAAGSGEIGKLQVAAAEGLFTANMLCGIAANAAMAFGLNLVSFQTNKVAGALTVSVCGNVKQVMTIILGIVLFNVKVGPLNATGMLVATAGAAYYSKVEVDRKKAAST